MIRKQMMMAAINAQMIRQTPRKRDRVSQLRLTMKSSLSKRLPASKQEPRLKRSARSGNSLRVSAVAAVVLIGCSLANGQDKRVDLAAGNIEISLVLPAELLPFSEEKMALIREKGIAAKFVFSDSRGDLIAAINTFGRAADEKGLSKVGEQIIAAAEKQSAQVEWLANQLITMNGKKWLRMAFKDGPRPEDLINEYFVTDWIGEYVLLNFSSPAAKYDGYRAAVERSAQSIRLGLIASDIEVTKDAVKPAGKKH
jgi:hypothetical protein